MSATVQSIDTNKAEPERELTDGFHLIIDALKLNGLTTIYGVPGIPITDFGRMAQAEGIRVISFRHEQNAGNAAAIAGYLTKKPGMPHGIGARLSQRPSPRWPTPPPTASR
jgi:oxalyl-CoA decarboxylase